MVLGVVVRCLSELVWWYGLWPALQTGVGGCRGEGKLECPLVAKVIG